MRPRLVLAFLALSALPTVTPRPAAAAPPVGGTIACSAAGAIRFKTPFLPEEMAAPLTRPLGATITNDASRCDDTGVVGADIGEVIVNIQGKLAAGTSCADFLDSVSYAAKVRLRWRGGHGVGTSKTTVASLTYDSGTPSFVLVTNPIERGPFVGSTVTMRFPLAYADEYAQHCTNDDARYTAFVYSAGFGWTISIP